MGLRFSSLECSLNVNTPLFFMHMPKTAGMTMIQIIEQQFDEYVPQAVLARQPGCVQVSFEVEKTIRPLDVIPGSEDDRLLGIGLNWVEVEPALPFAQELIHLKKLGSRQNDLIADLNRQLQAAEGRNELIEPNHELKTRLQSQEELLKSTQRELNAIHSSRAWQLAQRFSAAYRALKRILGR